MRSPTSSATVSVEVATAMPTTSAAAASILRRGFRTNDSPTSRANISGFMNHRRRAGQRGEIDEHFSAFHARFYGDGIAAAAIADRGNVDHRAAVAADHVLPFLAISLPAADLARVE